MADPDNIAQHIQDALNQRELDNQYNVSPIAYHVHNGTDSPQIDYVNLTNKPTIPAAVTIPAAPLMPFYGSENEIANTYLYTFAYLPDWSLMVSPAGSGAGVAKTYVNFGLDKQAPFLQFSSPSITPATTIIHSCYYSPTLKFLMAGEAASPTIYSYDANSTLTSETALTVSGTTLANCLGLTADSTYVYIMVTTSSVKRFTLSGSTLTFVNTITLGTATGRYLAVDGTYLYSMDAANSKYYLYDKVAGTTSQTRTIPNLTTTNFRGMCFDPDGKLRQLMSSRTIGAVTSLQWYISRLSLI